MDLFVTSSLETLLDKPIDVYKSIKRNDIEVANGNIIATPNLGIDKSSIPLDVATWLPFAAQAYNVSSDIKDYIIVPVLTLPSDIPNRNGVGFPLKELLKFTRDTGMPAYRTFKGKPCFYEHQNKDDSKARGVILDAYMKKANGYGNGKLWKVVALLSFDRTKDPVLCSDILSGKRNSYSMGALVGGYNCSYCMAPLGQCTHISSGVNFSEIKGKLVYKLISDPKFIETSSVATPAYSMVSTDHILYGKG